MSSTFFKFFEKSFWVVLPSSCPSTLCSCSLWRLVHSEVCASGSCWFTFISRTTGLRAVVGLFSSGVLHGQLATSRSGSAPLTLRTEYTTFGNRSQAFFCKFFKKFFSKAGSRAKSRASQPRTRGQKERAFSALWWTWWEGWRSADFSSPLSALPTDFLHGIGFTSATCACDLAPLVMQSVGFGFSFPYCAFSIARFVKFVKGFLKKYLISLTLFYKEYLL